MNQNSPFFPTVARILELISSNQEIARQINSQLLNLKEEFETIPIPNGLYEVNNVQDVDNLQVGDELNSNDRHLLNEVKDTMANKKAFDFLEEIRNKNNLSLEKLKQLTVTIANKCDIQTDSKQFRTLDNIYKWFDDNWDKIEEFALLLQIVNCDNK